MQSFIALNNTFSVIVSMLQVGLDIAPTKAQIDTWETDCRNYTRTLTAWKKMQSEDLTAFNALLTKSNLEALTTAPTKLTAPSCTFAPPPAARRP